MGLKEFIEISRPSNALFSGVAVLLGALVAGGDWKIYKKSS